MEREGSMGGLSLDFEKMSLEKGRPLDVDDLDDDGWAAASDQKKIIELGSLGEGAGGAVTRCKLEDAPTIFALKVSQFSSILHGVHLTVPDYNDIAGSGCQETNPSRTEVQQELYISLHLPVLRCFYGQVIIDNLDSNGILRGWKS
jgi:hypothetical protein